MAQKRSTTTKKKTASKKAATTKVTRIKASDKPHKLTPEEKATKRSVLGLRKSANAPKPAEVAEQEAEKKSRGSKNPLTAFWTYVKGAWYELRQVRWPDRANSWKMTGALLAFCAFFVVLILLLDAGFKYLFEQLIG